MKVHDQYSGNENVVFVSLTHIGSDELEETKAFLEDTGISWATAYGAEKTVNTLGVETIPSMFVFGTDGKLKWQGRVMSELKTAIDESLSS